MTPLKDILVRQIQATGPITLADYMATCLMHPEHGYYQRERVFGQRGDFITAPEISQMFGEMIALWLADRWTAMGKPDPFILVEAGPGRGTLMEDIFRTMGQVPGMGEACKIHFIEASQQLRELQAEKVPQATWHDDLDTLPDLPMLFVANEFFDALPIHQFIRKDGKWLEKRVAAVAGNLVEALTPVSAAVATLSGAVTASAREDDHAESSPAAIALASALSARLRTYGGAGLIIDYGYYPDACGDTFQALEKHKYVDPYDHPGKADLTAHVNFASLRSVALETGMACPAPVGQGDFLMALGIGERAARLASGKGESGQQEILTALRRLTAPNEMGALFKVLAMQSPDLAPAPGFQR